MEFKAFRDALAQHFEEMSKDKLFYLEVDSHEMWETYLAAFPEGSNPLYRTRTEHDCSLCRNFIRDVGGIVTIKNLLVTTIWDFIAPTEAYQIVVDRMNAYIKGKAIANVFLSKGGACGTLATYEEKDGKVIQYDHFRVKFPKAAVVKDAASIPTLQSNHRSSFAVFHRSLTELTAGSVMTVLELIAQNSLYRGAEWQGPLQEFLQYKNAFSCLDTPHKRRLFVWENLAAAGMAVGRIRNHSMGTLLVDLSEGMDPDNAVRRYEAIVAPANYKRPKAIFTQRMLEQAQQELTDLGYIEAIGRRHANLNDISVNNILFCNRDVTPRITGGDIFSELSKTVKTTPLKFSRVEEIPVDRFITDVLPTATEVEAYVENGHAKNMVSLIAPAVREAKSMFKWSNNFGWAYKGNVTDSMKERVKAAGGDVTGELRFSIQWNDVDDNQDDLDAHCRDAAGEEIYFGHKQSYRTRGVLDVDIMRPLKGNPAVENITWASRNQMVPGCYQFSVVQFSNRGGRGGFRAEIEFDGTVYHYEHNGTYPSLHGVPVAEVMMDASRQFTIKHLLPPDTTSKEVWGIKTNAFVPVSVVMFSPNYWDNQNGVGHRHWFFMLKGCTNPDEPNGFYNEFLKPELEKYRHVFEALGAKARVAKTEDQLSGIGFTAARKEYLVVKVKGQTERILKVLF